MALIDTLDKLFAAMDAGTPICEVMRNDERTNGFEIIKPGDVSWLSTDDWDETVVVSRDGNRIRLVAILAKNPGNGALTRTVKGILAAGLIPTIIEPTNEMRATCQRWGWKTRRVGAGFESYEIWYPRP